MVAADSLPAEASVIPPGSGPDHPTLAVERCAIKRSGRRRKERSPRGHPSIVALALRASVLTVMLARVVLALFLASSVSAVSIGSIFGRPKVSKIVLTNDDGWATAQMRAQMDALIAAGYDVSLLFLMSRYIRSQACLWTQVVMSGTSQNESGSSSKTAPPTVLNQTCEFGTCDVGSPAFGTNSSNCACMRLVSHRFGFWR